METPRATVIRLLRDQAMGGALVFIASKNVLAPGKEFGAYSAAKAAQTQLARVLAIENGEAGVRVNIVNPDGVFEGSGLWETIRSSRAKTYGIRPEEQKRLAAAGETVRVVGLDGLRLHVERVREAR